MPWQVETHGHLLSWCPSWTFAGPPVVLLMLAQRAVVVLDPLKQFASHCRGIRFDVLPLLQVAFERRAATWGIRKTEDAGSGTEENGRAWEG